MQSIYQSPHAFRANTLDEMRRFDADGDQAISRYETTQTTWYGTVQADMSAAYESARYLDVWGDPSRATLSELSQLMHYPHSDTSTESGRARFNSQFGVTGFATGGIHDSWRGGSGVYVEPYPYDPGWRQPSWPYGGGLPDPTYPDTSVTPPWAGPGDGADSYYPDGGSSVGRRDYYPDGGSSVGRRDYYPDSGSSVGRYGSYPDGGSSGRSNPPDTAPGDPYPSGGSPGGGYVTPRESYGADKGGGDGG